MFNNTSFSDNEITSLIAAESPVIEKPDIFDSNDRNGAIAEILSMAVEKIDVVIDYTGFMPADD